MTTGRVADSLPRIVQSSVSQISFSIRLYKYSTGVFILAGTTLKVTAISGIAIKAAPIIISGSLIYMTKETVSSLLKGDRVLTAIKKGAIAPIQVIKDTYLKILDMNCSSIVNRITDLWNRFFAKEEEIPSSEMLVREAKNETIELISELLSE